MSYNIFAQTVGIDLVNEADIQFCKLFCQANNNDLGQYRYIIFICRAVQAYEVGGYCSHEKRYNYLHPASSRKLEEDEEEDDGEYDYEYNSDDDEEEMPNENISDSHEVSYSSNKQSLFESTPSTLSEVIERDIEIINGSVTGVTTSFKAIENVLYLCIVIEPSRLYDNKLEAFWHDIDFNRHLAFIITFTYKVSLKTTQSVSELNEAKSVNCMGFQTTDTAEVIIENYISDTTHYHGLGGVYPISNCLQILLSNDPVIHKNIDSETTTFLNQYTSKSTCYADVLDIGRTLNDYILPLLLANNNEINSKSSLQDAVNYYLLGENNSNKYNTIKFSECSIARLINLHPLIPYDIIVDTVKQNKYDFHLSDLRLNSLGKICETPCYNRLNEIILLKETRYYCIISIIEYIVKQLNHRCMYCFVNLYKSEEFYTPCENELCKNNYNELQGFGLEDVVLLHGYTLELLITYYIAAASENGRGFLNAPTVSKPKILSKEEMINIMKEGNTKKLNSLFESVVPDDLIKEAEEKCVDVNNKMNAVIEKIPCIETMIEKAREHNLYKYLLTIDELLYKLLVWIFYNNENKIVHIPNSLIKNGNSISHIFYIKRGNPSSEERYNDLLKKNTKFKYYVHGSPYGCWHSIIKQGIRNMSRTKYMTCGAAYGDGVYLADQLHTSLGYARAPFTVNWKNRIGYSLTCLAVTESTGAKDNRGIFVQPDEKLVFPRMLLVWNNSINNLNFKLNDIPGDLDELIKNIDINEIN